MKALLKTLAITLGMISLAGHATDQSGHGWPGHFATTKVDDTHYKVVVDGAGDKGLFNAVWLYRCAQLTQEKGYAYFRFETVADNVSEAQSSADTVLRNESVMAMYGDDVPEGKVVFRADVVMGALADYVNTNGKTTPPNSKDLFETTGFRMTADHRMVTLREFKAMSHLAGADRIAESRPLRPGVMGLYNLHPLPNGPVVAQTTDAPSTLLAAQAAASQMGCNDVQAAGNDTYTAQCSSYQVLLTCDGTNCRPAHVVR